MDVIQSELSTGDVQCSCSDEDPGCLCAGQQDISIKCQMHIDIDPYAVYKVNWLDPGHQQSVIWITEMYRRLFLLDQETD